MVAKHTPGPWRNQRGRGDHQREITADNGRIVVCETISAGHGDNGNLIAAAPELLEACQLVEQFINAQEFGRDYGPKQYEKMAFAIRSAIRQATIES